MKLPTPLRIAALAALLLIALVPAPAHALKIATWNLMGYENPGEGPGLPTPYITVRQANFRTVMAALDPDVITCEEMNSAAAKDSFLLDVLGNVEPGQWAGTWVDVGSGEGMGVFWKTALVSVTQTAAVKPTGDPGPRSKLQALMKPVGYVKNGAWSRLYAVHFKAGNTSADSTTRAGEAAALRTYINGTATTVGPNFLLGGDTNIYNNNGSILEGAWLRLIESQTGSTGNNGRGFDEVTMSGPWHQNAANAKWDSQCPCQNCTVTGQSGGGLDDRFDILLTSASLQDGAGMDYVAGTYTPFGNDGWHFNTDINGYLGGGEYNLAVPLNVANALHDAADHIPVMITLQLPAKYAVASQLSFGDAIVGGSPTQSLAVTDAGPVPSATLVYTLAASSGFSAPGGSFNALAGAGANTHTLGMDASTVGVKSGTITLASNDNDTTSKAILVSGRVLAHAVPSLDSVTVSTSGSIDFGEQPVGGFSDQPVTVFDQGFGALQARLAVSAATITGDSHFSIAGGFTPVTFGSPGQSWAVHFDDTTAQVDSTYDATLTFSTADDALPGATALAPLTVSLHAHVISGGTGVGGQARVLRFYPPAPNPGHGGSLLAFDLPRPAHVALGVYDLSGRRVATLADGILGEGHHMLRWNAQDEAGRSVQAGLYFVRFETPGLTRVSRLALLP